jgi:hypothetical protein
MKLQLISHFLHKIIIIIIIIIIIYYYLFFLLSQAYSSW